MEIGNFISNAIKNYKAGEYNIALSLTCSALDATAKKINPHLNNNRRIKKFISDNMRIVSFFGLPGISCGRLRIGCDSISEIKKDAQNRVGLEDVIYHAIRCNLIHECKPDPRIEFTTHTHIGGEKDGKFFLPSQILNGLIFSVLLQDVNEKEKVDFKMEIKLPNKTYDINELWGKKEELMPVMLRLVK
jgi:hypothetical protein